MDHLEKHDALSPLSPPHQKYLEIVKHIADFQENCRFCCFFHLVLARNKHFITKICINPVPAGAPRRRNMFDYHHIQVQ